MNTMRQEEAKPKSTRPSFRMLRVAIIVLVSLAALGWLAKWMAYRITHVTTDAAFVKADIVELAPLVSGHVKVLFVDEGVSVTEGQILGALDDRDYQRALDREEAAFTRAELAYERAKKLHATRTIADAKFEDAEAQYKEAKAARDQAALNVQHTRLVSPINGVIAKRYVEPGDFVPAGLPAFALFDPTTLHVMANLEEGKMSRVKPGARVDLFFDAVSDVLHGKVLRIGEATAAEFALIPRDVTSGEFTKVVQRVPIKISLPPREQHPFLRPGLSVNIGIDKD